jgi:hypothetical protein
MGGFNREQGKSSDAYVNKGELGTTPSHRRSEGSASPNPSGRETSDVTDGGTLDGPISLHC